MKKLLTLTVLALLTSVVSFALTPIIGPSSACTGNTVYLDDSLSPGGIWTSSNTSVATIVGYPPYGAFLTAISSGVSVITYSLGSSYVTMSFTVTPGPTPISGSTHMCVSGSTTFSDATPGGIWTSSNPSVASIGSISGIASGLASGTTLIDYTIGSCTTSVLDTVGGGPYVDSVIYGTKTFCVSSSTTLSDKTPGGAWSSSNPSVGTVSTSGVVSGLTTGTTIISYTVTGPCGSSSAVCTVSVVSTVSADTISGGTTVVVTGTTTLFDIVAGGTWSSSNPSIATISSSGVVTGVAVGTTTITYTVAGCGGSAYTTKVVTVIPYDVISGQVLFSGSGFTGQVKVWLITYNAGTSILAAVDSAQVWSSGSSASYKFTNNPTDSYRVKAALYDTSGTLVGTSGFIPTYHNSSYYWYSANVIAHTFGTADINKDINMISGIVPSGPGFIAGNVSSGANKGTGGSTPVVGLRIYVLSSTGTLLQTTVTDASGNYTFSGLALGTYTVFPEALNYKTTAYTSVKITSSSITASGTNFVQHTKSMTITPVTAAVSNVSANTSSVAVFPNPSNGILNMQWDLNDNEKGIVTVADITGRQVYSRTIDMSAGTNADQLNLSGLTSGLYMISIKSASINFNSKINIQK